MCRQKKRFQIESCAWSYGALSWFCFGFIVSCCLLTIHLGGFEMANFWSPTQVAISVRSAYSHWKNLFSRTNFIRFSVLSICLIFGQINGYANVASGNVELIPDHIIQCGGAGNFLQTTRPFPFANLPGSKLSIPPYHVEARLPQYVRTPAIRLADILDGKRRTREATTVSFNALVIFFLL